MAHKKLEEAVEFIENPEPRCPCVLLVDTSGSMRGAPIDALNQGISAFREDLAKDNLASRRVEVGIVSFGSEVKVIPFVTVDQFEPPTLTAQGVTKMGTAINTALDMVQERKELYRQNGVAYYRPWIFMITDGEPQGEPDDIVAKAAKRVHEEEESKRVAFFAVGVEGANMSRLATISVRAPVKLIGLKFVEMFVWLSRSTQAVSHSRLDDMQIGLPPAGWGTV